ncbi:MAG: 8-oxoguanine deaminase [Candidatus Marinimicrobia bacterium]|nr:8-oxoguanine deaminase [Candidatus Neomarinimicrobiota bacterium]
MGTTLIKDTLLTVTMDDELGDIKNGWVLVKDGEINSVGDGSYPVADKTVNASGMILLPGFINTHHHMFQTLTRNIPGTQNAYLFDWLQTLYDVWGELSEEAIYVSAQVAAAELILSGCTTSSDHLYLFPSEASNKLIDKEIEAVSSLGLRFHPTRGSMSLGKSSGGLPPDYIVQTEEEIIDDSIRLIEKYHDAEPHSMLRIALAPCSPFSVTQNLMKKSRELADKYKVRLHTHLAETLEEEKFCLDIHGLRPVEFAESLGWLGEDVWLAHAVHLNDDEIQKLSDTKTGVAHCPTSNMRLGSGIAPIAKMLDAGVKISIAVDGSASNDSSNMLSELRQALLVPRLRDDRWLTAREIMRMSTVGGAQILGRDDIGVIKIGASADLILFDLSDISYAGAKSDPLAALLFCSGNQRVSWSMINGRIVVEDGQILDLNLVEISTRADKISEEMINRSENKKTGTA